MQQPLTEKFIEQLASQVPLNGNELESREGICIAIKQAIRYATHDIGIMCAVFVKDPIDKQKIVDYTKGRTNLFGDDLGV